MKLNYDFHLHSCLSPCAEDDMTPYNLVNMAALLELDIIALTDHNSCANCAAAVAAGVAAGVTVVPGMELCTAEEIHVICLFPDCEQAAAFAAHVRENLPDIANKPEYFGHQRIMDAQDALLGEENIMLVGASMISVDDVPALVARFGGVCWPAHVDRDSYSIIAVFGDIGKHQGFGCAEFSTAADESALMLKYPALCEMQPLYSSDAHRLEDMDEARAQINLTENSAAALIEKIKSYS